MGPTEPGMPAAFAARSAALTTSPIFAGGAAAAAVAAAAAAGFRPLPAVGCAPEPNFEPALLEATGGAAAAVPAAAMGRGDASGGVNSGAGSQVLVRVEAPDTSRASSAKTLTSVVRAGDLTARPAAQAARAFWWRPSLANALPLRRYARGQLGLAAMAASQLLRLFRYSSEASSAQPMLHRIADRSVGVSDDSAFKASLNSSMDAP